MIFVELFTIEPIFGLSGTAVPGPPLIILAVPRMRMVSFPMLMYPDDIRIQRVRWEEIQGTPVAKYDTDAEPQEKASVQSKTVARTDPEGRTTIETVHTVRTPTNRNISAQDHILWRDKSGSYRTLTAEGGSTPKGIGDVQWMTECVESV